MTIVKARSRSDEPVTQEVLEQAIQRGRKRDGVRATSVQYIPLLKALVIGFRDHSAVALPAKNYPELATLKDAELRSLSLGFGGSALCLDAHDLHMSIAGMVSASEPLMDMAATLIAARNGSKRSAVKTEASRANGQKGGRPRKSGILA